MPRPPSSRQGVQRACGARDDGEYRRRSPLATLPPRLPLERNALRPGCLHDRRPSHRSEGGRNAPDAIWLPEGGYRQVPARAGHWSRHQRRRCGEMGTHRTPRQMHAANDPALARSSGSPASTRPPPAATSKCCGTRSPRGRIPPQGRPRYCAARFCPRGARNDVVSRAGCRPPQRGAAAPRRGLGWTSCRRFRAVGPAWGRSGRGNGRACAESARRSCRASAHALRCPNSAERHDSAAFRKRTWS